jgi:hypothetical protein
MPKAYIAVLRVQQPPNLAAAGFYARGECAAGEIVGLHGLGNLPCQQLLDDNCSGDALQP